jgi:hypothetical protein
VGGTSLSYSNDILKVNTPDNFYGHTPGEVHIGGSGYDLITPYIEGWMEKLSVYVAP